MREEEEKGERERGGRKRRRRRERERKERKGVESEEGGGREGSQVTLTANRTDNPVPTVHVMMPLKDHP